MNLSPFPHSLSISSFSHHFLFIFSFSLHFFAARLPGCHKLCNCAVGATVGTNIVHVGVTNASVGIDGTKAMDGSYATDRSDFTPFIGKVTDSFISASK